jgi:hypothetical protein
MMGFMFNMAVGQIAARVVGNSLSGESLFSGFFSKPEPKYRVTTTYIPVTIDHKKLFWAWAFGDIPSSVLNGFEADKEYMHVHIIYYWNSRRGHLFTIGEEDSLENNLLKMWKMWEKLEN